MIFILGYAVIWMGASFMFYLHDYRKAVKREALFPHKWANEFLMSRVIFGLIWPLLIPLGILYVTGKGLAISFAWLAGKIVSR